MTIAVICVSLALAAPSFAIDVVNLSNSATWYLFACDDYYCDWAGDPGLRLLPGGRVNDVCVAPCDIYAAPYEFADEDELVFGAEFFPQEGLIGITEDGWPVRMEAGR